MRGTLPVPGEQSLKYGGNTSCVSIEFAKGQFVLFSNEEIKALNPEATSAIEITERVLLDTVDPVYRAKTEGHVGEVALKILHETAALHDRGMDERRGGEPRQECGVLDRIPRPVATPPEGLIAPPGPEDDAQGQEAPGDDGPAPGGDEPPLPDPTGDQRTDGEGEDRTMPNRSDRHRDTPSRVAATKADTLSGTRCANCILARAPETLTLRPNRYTQS